MIFTNFSNLVISYHFGLLLFLEHVKLFPASDLITCSFLSLECCSSSSFYSWLHFTFWIPAISLPQIFLNHSICTSSPNPPLPTSYSLTYYPVYLLHRTTWNSFTLCIVCLLPSECKHFMNKGLLLARDCISKTLHIVDTYDTVIKWLLFYLIYY